MQEGKARGQADYRQVTTGSVWAVVVSVGQRGSHTTVNVGDTLALGLHLGNKKEIRYKDCKIRYKNNFTVTGANAAFILYKI